MRFREKSKRKIHVTKNFIRERQFNPSLCRGGTFRTKKVSPKTEIVLCKKKGSQKQSVQSILKKKSYFRKGLITKNRF